MMRLARSAPFWLSVQTDTQFDFVLGFGVVYFISWQVVNNMNKHTHNLQLKQIISWNLINK